MGILNYATPAFVLLMLFEVWYDWRKQTGYYRLNDTVGSLATGILSQSTRLIVFSLGLWAMSGLNGKFLPLWSMDSVWAWGIAFIVYDLSYYWKHRFSHEVNFLWAGHSVHHQSEEYNLSTALRQPSTHILTWIFAIPLLILGIPWQMIVVCAAWNLIYQFWVHTRHIDRMPGFFEALMVTPSHHRVHHAQNPEYIDKNHGGVFIIWDKMFATFQCEKESVPPIYGVRRPLQSFSPLKANFQLWRQMFEDAVYTKSWKDKARVWFMPTGWRPKDVELSRPITKYPLESFEKYNPESALWVKLYAALQIALAAILSLVLAQQASTYTANELYFSWFFMSIPLLSVALMLDKQNLRWEFMRIALSWLILIWVPGIFTNLVWWLAFVGQSLATALFLYAMWPPREPLGDLE